MRRLHEYGDAPALAICFALAFIAVFVVFTRGPSYPSPAPAALLRAYLRDESAREGQCRGRRPRVVFVREETER